MCPDCQSLEHDVVDLHGTGEIYSYSLLHHPRNPRFGYPIAAVLVDLDEGIRMVSNLVDVDPADIRIGLPVEVALAPADDGMMVPVFRPRSAAS
jgi:hypothetical protein